MITKRCVVPFLLTAALAAPAVSEAATVGYLGQGTKAERMAVGFFLKDRRAVKNLTFRQIPMRCGGGRRYRIDGRRFGEAIRVRKGRFRARGAGSFPDGREVAVVEGRINFARGRATGELRVTATRGGGTRCASGPQPWAARRG